MAYPKLANRLVEDSIVSMKVRVTRHSDDERTTMSVLEVMPLVLERGTPELRLNLPATSLDGGTVARLKEILASYPGDAQVFIHLGQSKVLKLGPEFTVDVDRVIPPLRVAFGVDVVR